MIFSRAIGSDQPARHALMLHQSAATRRSIQLLVCITLLLAALAVCAATARADVAAEIRHRIEMLHGDGRLSVSGQTLYATAVLQRFYVTRDFLPLWLDDAGPLPAAHELIEAIHEAAHHGLPVARYRLEPIEARFDAGDRPGQAELELLLSDAFIAQVVHRSTGVLDPVSIDDNWLISRSEVDPESALRRVASGERVRDLLHGLWPQDSSYWTLLEERTRLAVSAADRPVSAGGGLLKPGMSDPRVVQLKRRLGLADTGTQFDEETAVALRAFQTAAGLQPDAIVGPATLAELNRTPAERMRTIEANLERWRWLPRVTPDEHITVNIADFSLVYVLDGRRQLTMDVVVGRPYRSTPVFTESMKYLVFNPYWDVPRKLAVEDKLADLKRDPAAQEALGFEAAPAASPGVMTGVTRVDWSRVSANNFSYYLRQRPGPANALGRVKFMLPNPYAIYLHDTPSRDLFAARERPFSSGCIRVADALALAEVVLARQGWSRARIDAAVASGRTAAVTLQQPIPVYLVYFTALADETGAVRYRRDVYNRDPRLIAALRETN